MSEDLAARYALARVYGHLRPRLIWLACCAEGRVDEEAIMRAAREGGLAAAIEEQKAQLVRLGADPAGIEATVAAARRGAELTMEGMDPARIESYTVATEQNARAERSPR